MSLSRFAPFQLACAEFLPRWTCSVGFRSVSPMSGRIPASQGVHCRTCFATRKGILSMESRSKD